MGNCQQFGRSLRVMINDPNWSNYDDAYRRMAIAASRKPHAIVIDHVGNVAFHGLPDLPQTYVMADREARSSRSKPSIALRICVSCTQPYERFLVQCPYCGYAPTPAGRSKPEEVEGDLIELDPAVLARLRGEVARIDSAPLFPQSAPPHVRYAIQHNHGERQVAQNSLRAAIDLWGGWQLAQGRDLRTGQRLFFHRFGIDTLTAQTLGATDAAALEARIRVELNSAGVVGLLPHLPQVPS